MKFTNKMRSSLFFLLVSAALLPVAAAGGEARGGSGGRPEASTAGPRSERYELSVMCDTTWYFTLNVFEMAEDGRETETVYGLRRASMYLPADYKSGDWMLFLGERPPAYEAAGVVAVSKDPWLIRFRDGEWSVAKVNRHYGKNGVYTLLRVQQGKDGSPELVYLNGDGEEDIKSPDGWAADSKRVVKPGTFARIKRFKFVSR